MTLAPGVHAQSILPDLIDAWLELVQSLITELDWEIVRLLQAATNGDLADLLAASLYVVTPAEDTYDLAVDAVMDEKAVLDAVLDEPAVVDLVAPVQLVEQLR